MSETELARMVVRLMGDATSYLGMLRTSVTATQQVTQALSMQSRQIEGYYQNIIGFGNQVKYTFLSALGVVSGFGIALGSIQKAAAAEDLEIAFGTFLQDMKAGKALMGEIQKFAASTPLGTQQIAQVTKQLLQAQAATAETAIPTIRMLGDIAGGNAERLNGLAYAFGQVKTFGRLMGGELMQLMNQGFNPLDQIAKMTGKSQGELRKEMEKGLITFDMVRNAMVAVTSEGGRFFNGMDNASKTLSGLWSTLKDEIDLTLQAIGEALVKGFDLKQVIRDLTVFAGEVRKGTEIAAKGFIFVKDNVTNLIKANLELIITVGKVIGILAGLWATFKFGMLLIGTLIFLLKVLKVDLILNTALWIVWKAIILAWSVAVMGASAAGLIFKGIVWLINAALTVMNLLLLPAGVVAFAAALATAVIAISAITAGAIAGYAAIKGLIGAGQAIVTVFSGLGNSVSGPMAKVTEMLGDWKNLASDLSTAIQYDFGLAWKFVQAYAMLAFEQVKALWPPTARFIVDVANIVWREMKSQFVMEFAKGMNEAYEISRRTAIEIGKVLLLSTTPLGWAILQDEREMKKRGEEAANAINEGMAANAGKHWQLEIKEATNRFNEALKNMDQEGIKGANERLGKLRQQSAIAQGFKQIRDAGKDVAKDVGKAGEEAAAGLKPIEKAAEHAHHAMQKLQGTLVGSQEGFSRLLEQRDMLEGRNIGRNQIDMKSGRITLRQDKVEKLLGDVANNTAKLADNNTGPAVLPANI